MVIIMVWILVVLASRALVSDLRKRKQPRQWALHLGRHDTKLVSMIRNATVVIVSAIVLTSLALSMAKSDVRSAMASMGRCGDSLSCKTDARERINSAEVVYGRIDSLLNLLLVL